MPVIKTISAQSICESFNGSISRSTSRRSQSRGNKPDTVISPSGGKSERFPSNGNACRKLQYVSGNSGLTSNTFIARIIIDSIQLGTSNSCVKYGKPTITQTGREIHRGDVCNQCQPCVIN